MNSFYKMDPAAWDFGNAELTLEQEAAFLRIVNAIHKHDQPVPNNDRVLSGMFRCSTRKARALVAALVEAGILRIENDRITNDRAVSDPVQRGFVSVSKVESGAKGGRTRANNAAKTLKNNEPRQANASSRIEENKIEVVGGSAGAKNTELTLREKLLWAAGIDPQSIIDRGPGPGVDRSTWPRPKGGSTCSEATQMRSFADEATADLADILDEHGGVRPVADWPLIWRQALVAGFEVAEMTVEGVKVGQTVKVKLSDRIKRLELIGKHVGVQRERLEEVVDITYRDGMTADAAGMILPWLRVSLRGLISVPCTGIGIWSIG